MDQADFACLIETWAQAADRIAWPPPWRSMWRTATYWAHSSAVATTCALTSTGVDGEPVAAGVRVHCRIQGAGGDRLAVLVRVSGEEYGQDRNLTLLEATEAAVHVEREGADVIRVADWSCNSFVSFPTAPLWTPSARMWTTPRPSRRPCRSPTSAWAACCRSWRER